MIGGDGDHDAAGEPQDWAGGEEHAPEAIASDHPPQLAPEHERLDLAETDHLPWLEAGEEEEEYYGVDTGRVISVVLAGLALLAAIVGGVWWTTHRHDAGQPVADGSVVPAPAQPYKEAPKAPGGKTFDGTGDSSFAVSQGHSRPASLADGGDGTAAKPATPDKPAAASPATNAAKPAATGADNGAAAANAGVVQVGAYSSQATAETGWARLAQQYDALSGLHHRIVEGQADIGTVYRLQALTAPGGGGALCDKLRGAGLACQVKR